MKAITVLQPWAWLLAIGKKRCETRSWKTNYRGEILIHAGKRDMTDVMRQTIFEAGHMEQAGVFDTKIITGAVIGKTTLVNCVPIDEAIAALVKAQHPDESAFGDFTPGRYAWVMEGAELFDQPVPAAGKQGLWNFNGCLLPSDLAGKN